MKLLIIKGTKIKLLYMHKEPQMPSGLIGIVDFIDSANQIHIQWENGSSLAINTEIDKFEIL